MPEYEAEITHRLSRDYRALRKKLFHELCRRHSNRTPADILRSTQTILARILFIAFAEDRGLLPDGTLKTTCDYRDGVRSTPTWNNFCVLFRWIDQGHEAKQIPCYSGGLFTPNPHIDELEVNDEICAEFMRLTAYDYLHDVSVEALGQIFEQSISELEELRRSSGIVLPDEEKTSRRKAEGVFYTPVFVTRYIVDQTLGRTFQDRWQAIMTTREPSKKLKVGSDAWVAAWTSVYEAYREDIKKIRVLDLSCGAGAFLIAAFDALSREYDRVNTLLANLNKGQSTIFDLTKTVLNNNLFGVDVNAESVEITKLSLWLKTAERGRKLTYLDSNIKWGNSLVKDPMVHSLAFDWATGDQVRPIYDLPNAPEAAEINARWREGFDVVIGNPPYVRHELLGKFKDHFEKSFRAYHGMADLFVYFFERGISVLKPGGRLGFIVANKWLRGGYAEPLRKLLATETTLESIVDFGHAPIFPDADAFPCILTLSKRAPHLEPNSPHDIDVTMFPREELAATEIPDYVSRHGYAVPQMRLGAAPWSLEPPASDALMAKIRARGVPLTNFAGVKPYRGILTGFNEAFLLDDAQKRRLCEDDPRSSEILKKYVRGQDVGRWSTEWGQTWLIFANRGIDITRYPAILRHLEQFRDSLEPRPRDWSGSSWPGRKPGNYQWYELQDTVDYWRLLDAPKILYQEIQFYPAYALDSSGLFVTNKVFILPIADTWLLAVLNSPLMWWHNWRYLTHLKDEALTPLGVKMEVLPIAAPSPAAREQADAAVTKLIALKKTDDASRAAVLDALRMQYDVAEPGNKLHDFATLDSDAFIKEVMKRRPKAAGKLKTSDMKSLREMYGDEALPIQARRREALILERRLGNLVNEAYGLTPEEVALLWSTAPPRMPFKPE